MKTWVPERQALSSRAPVLHIAWLSTLQPRPDASPLLRVVAVWFAAGLCSPTADLHGAQRSKDAGEPPPFICV